MWTRLSRLLWGGRGGIGAGGAGQSASRARADGTGFTHGVAREGLLLRAVVPSGVVPVLSVLLARVVVLLLLLLLLHHPVRLVWCLHRPHVSIAIQIERVGETHYLHRVVEVLVHLGPLASVEAGRVARAEAGHGGRGEELRILGQCWSAQPEAQLPSPRS